MSKKVFPPLILQLSDRRPSGFVMQGTEGSDNPDHLDVSSEYLMLRTSMRIDKDGNRIPTRYIKGCPDIDVEVQEKNSRKPNPREDVIIFEFGHLTVMRENTTIGLYDFLATHANNASLPDDSRPEGAENIFYQINTAAKAEEEMVDMEDLQEALTIILSLRKNSGTKKDPVYAYDDKKINHYCKLFGIVGMETAAEKVNVLRRMANENTEFFLSLIRETTGDMRIEITTARELGVISLEGESASFKDDGKTFYKFKEKKDLNKRVDELVNYFGSKDAEAELNFDILRAKLGAVQNAQLEVN